MPEYPRYGRAAVKTIVLIHPQTQDRLHRQSTDRLEPLGLREMGSPFSPSARGVPAETTLDGARPAIQTRGEAQGPNVAITGLASDTITGY